MADRRTRTAPAGLLIRVDVACLAASCASYARWHTAEEALARMDDHDDHTGALLVKTADGNVRRNPLVKIAADAAADSSPLPINLASHQAPAFGSVQAATDHHRRRSSTGC
jgi:phage terminase small subunit